MLSSAQVDQFHDEGYLVIPDVLGDADLTPVEAEYEEALEAAALSLHACGEITSTYAGLPFSERYTALVCENPAVFYYLGISLPLGASATRSPSVGSSPSTDTSTSSPTTCSGGRAGRPAR